MSQGPLRQFVTTCNGINVSYWTNEVENPTITALFLTGGPTDGAFVNAYLPEEIGIKLYVVDFPGRGKTDPVEDRSIESVAHFVLAFISALKLKNLVLIGISFGGAVANEVLKLDSGAFKKVVLICTGEFFSIPRKLLFKGIFFPAKYSQRIRKIYKEILIRHTIVISKRAAMTITDKNLKPILNQWLAILNYNIDTSNKIPIPALLIKTDKDECVRKESEKKLKAIYPNLTVKEMKGSHCEVYTNPDRLKELINTIFSEVTA